MDFYTSNYIVGKLLDIMKYGTVAMGKGEYVPSYNVALMMEGISQLICTIKDETYKEQESK